MPLIFILSSGADPVKGLMAYAEQSGMGGSFDYISLGQGQGPKAEKLIRVGKEQGRLGRSGSACSAGTLFGKW